MIERCKAVSLRWVGTLTSLTMDLLAPDPHHRLAVYSQHIL